MPSTVPPGEYKSRRRFDKPPDIPNPPTRSPLRSTDEFEPQSPLCQPPPYPSLSASEQNRYHCPMGPFQEPNLCSYRRQWTESVRTSFSSPQMRPLWSDPNAAPCRLPQSPSSTRRGHLASPMNDRRSHSGQDPSLGHIPGPSTPV